MVEFVLTYWKACVIVVAIVVFMEALRRLEWHWELKRPISDEEYLSFLARRQRISEFELFHISSREWRVPTRLIEKDFNNYLITGNMPHYVRDYVRKARAEEKAGSRND